MLSKTISAFIKHHRIQQQLTQQEVADKANISRSTLSLLERGETVTVSTLLQVLRVLLLLHVMDVFRVNEPMSHIALAKAEKKKRQRVKKGKASAENESEW